MGNIITRAVTRPDIHPNIISHFDARLDATVEKLAANQAQFKARTEQANLLIAELEAQVAKNIEYRRTMIEVRMTTRALRKKVDRLGWASKNAELNRRLGRVLPGKKLMMKKKRRGIMAERVAKCSQRRSGGSKVPAGGSQRFWERDPWEEVADEARQRRKEIKEENEQRAVKAE